MGWADLYLSDRRVALLHPELSFFQTFFNTLPKPPADSADVRGQGAATFAARGGDLVAPGSVMRAETLVVFVQSQVLGRKQL
jgi:hypothetical protein